MMETGRLNPKSLPWYQELWCRVVHRWWWKFDEGTTWAANEARKGLPKVAYSCPFCKRQLFARF